MSDLQQSKLYSIFTDKLNKLTIPYAVTGSVASIFYGEPRMTHDIDMVLHLAVNRVDAFLKAFPASEFYTPPQEILISEIRRPIRGHCNIIHHNSGFKADIYFVGTDEFQQWAIQNSKVMNIDGFKISLAPPEYVIIKKLEFYREGAGKKHLDDIRNIINFLGTRLQTDIIKQYVSQYKLTDEWAQCCAD